MILYAVTSRVRFGESKDVKQIQSVSFHGDSFRDVAQQRWTCAYLGKDSYDPLHLVRDGRRIPNISSPHIDLVVSPQVKSTLSRLPNIKFLQVVVERLVDFYIADGDFSLYEERNDFDHWKALREAPSFKDDIDDVVLYETLMAHHSDIIDKYAATHEEVISFPELDSPNYTASTQLLNDYPLHCFEGCFIMSAEVFADLELFFDWRFYAKQRLVMHKIK